MIFLIKRQPIMCGRFGLDQPPKKVIATLEEAGIAIRNKLNKEKLPKLNIPPSVPIITVINKDDENILESTKWGIKFSDKSPLIFNSRIETIREKSFWLRLFNKNRALVPMDRFYEWKRISKNEKIPHEIYIKNSDIFFVPALYFKIKDQVCTSLITTVPNTFMAKIHNRMPVILNAKQAKKYLTQSVEENFELCVPYKNNKDMGMEEVEI
jgi:putative SOS response-associated peptidase YedK